MIISRINQVRRKIPLYNKADWCSFHDHMTSVHNSIQDMALTCSVDDLWTFFKQGILTGIDKYIPHKFAKARNGKPWVKKPLQRLIAKRNRHYSKYIATGSRYHKDKYKQTKAKVQKGIRSSYWAYVEDIATSQETKASHGKCNKKFWSFIKHSRKESSGIPDLKASDGSILTNSKAKANLLNQHFHSVFSSPDTPLHHSQHSPNYPCMPPIEIKTAGIDKLISELDEHKACGPDGIRPIILKRLRSFISPTLQCIFAKSLAEGQVPDDWRHANITPIHKKENRNDPANYRPISLTCVCCKLMEHIAVCNFMRHLEANHILNPNQHGFRKGLSCETQLVEFSHALLTNMHIGHQTDIIILDFAKAFDKVNHNKLIYKLKAHRVDVLTVEWIEAFLSSRSQVVVLDGTSSDSVPVTSGVPQGSVLGPALFLLYTNDLPDTIDSQVRLFADDTVLYRTIKSDTDHHRLQTDLDNLTEWAMAWDMQFHPAKCLVMNISKKRHPSKFTYSLHSTDLKTTDTAKYLGITISQDMKWTKHITQTCSRANRALGFIRRNIKVRSPRIKEKLYNSLVRPHVEYASAVWSPHEVKPIHQLEMVQRRAARWTLNRHHNTSSVKGMLEDLQWRTLEQRRTDCRLVLLFQIIHGLVQIPPTNYLQPSLNTTSRKNHNYTYQQCSTRTNYFKYSFFPYTTVVWNNLPYQLVNSPSVISFKAQVSKLQHIRK